VQPEGEQRREQGLGTWVTEAQRGGVLAVDVDGVVDGGERVGSGDRVVADALDAQQAPVGGEADLPQDG